MDSICFLMPAESNSKDLLWQEFQLQEQEIQMSRLNKRKQCLSQRELHTKYEQRHDCARQIYAMYKYFDATSPAVFALAVRIMDSALIRVNIPWRYLSCFSAACFFIGSKWIEDEFELSIPMLADLHYKQWKEVDLRRMEEKILAVLEWEMPRSTYLSFLSHMTKVLLQYQVSLPPYQVIRNAELLLLNEFSFVLKPAAVALGALGHSSRHSGVCGQDMAHAIVALQDFVEVLDSELHEIDQILDAEDRLQQAAYKNNKTYFPKVFETPCNSFCPDYRLYKIPEEFSDMESDGSVCYMSSPHASTSDCDDSDKENDESTSNTNKCIKLNSCEISPDRTVIKDSVAKQNVRKQADTEQTFYARDVAGPDQSLQHEQSSRTVLDSATLQNITEESSIVQYESSSQPLFHLSSSSEGYFSNEENISDHDSGCEQDSDEQDSCDEQDSSEQDFCREQDSSEQDSGYDPDSDFHDSSPYRACHQKSCMDNATGQALTFD